MEGRIKFENREGTKLRDILQGGVSVRERGKVAWIMGIIREVLPRGVFRSLGAKDGSRLVLWVSLKEKQREVEI